MTKATKLKMLFTNAFSFFEKETEPQKGYDIWAATYDKQPDNLMLALDEKVFALLLENISLKDKVVADIGCGTGRHWQKVFNKHAAKLIGFDVSCQMLKVLQEKYPSAETHLLQNNTLKEFKTESFDVIFSTLALAHIKNANEALYDWNNLLKKHGELIITDFHPVALENGSKRTFNASGKKITLKNYIHSLSGLRKHAKALHLKEINFIELNIDDNLKPFYEKKNALHIFEKVKGTKIIYGIHFIKEK